VGRGGIETAYGLDPRLLLGLMGARLFRRRLLGGPLKGLAARADLFRSLKSPTTSALLQVAFSSSHPTAMLLWTALLCLISVNLVFSEFVPPGMLVKYDPATVLKPVKDNLESKDLSDDVHLIRGLLMARQRACPTGYGECTNPAGRSVLLPLILSSLHFVPLPHTFLL